MTEKYVSRLLMYGAVIAVTLASGLASAAPILPSGFGIIGPGALVFQSGGVNFIDWCALNAPSPNPAATCGTNSNAGNGSFFVASPGQVGTEFDITALPPGTPGTILDLVDQPGHSPYTYFPTSGMVFVNNLISFASHPDWNFQGNNMVTATSCGSSDICTGPFKLSPNATGTAVIMGITGTFTDSTNHLTAPFTATFTGQFDAMTPAQVAAAAITSGGAFSNSWSASINVRSAVPEPTTLTSMLVGVLLIGGGLSRRRRTAR